MGSKAPRPLPDNPPPRVVGGDRPTSPPPPGSSYWRPAKSAVISEEDKASLRAGLRPIARESLQDANLRLQLTILVARRRLADAIAERNRHYAENTTDGQKWGAYFEGRRQELQWLLGSLGEQAPAQSAKFPAAMT